MSEQINNAEDLYVHQDDALFQITSLKPGDWIIVFCEITCPMLYKTEKGSDTETSFCSL